MCERMKVTNYLDVLVVGAGPTGLTAAAEAKRLGLTVRIIDRKEARSTHDSRALVVHPRPMELLNAMGNGRVTDDIISAGFNITNLNIRFGRSNKPFAVPVGGDKARFGDTQFPFMTWLPQYETERVIQKELEVLGGEVEWGTVLKSLSQSDDKVETTVLLPDGSEERIVSRFVVGCDGGRSKTRDLVGINMHRAKSMIYFIVADVMLTNPPVGQSKKEPYLYLHPKGVTILFPLPGNNCYRIIAEAPKGVTNECGTEIDKSFIDSLLLKRTGISFNCRVGEWATVFQITHGIADSYRNGRVFLAGDASHVHSPVGGQGMNFGIQDAMNLMYKLAWATRCEERACEERGTVETILDSYDAERRVLGSKLIKEVESGTHMLFTHCRIIQKTRNLAMKKLAPRVSKKRLRKLGQLKLRYSSSSPIICDRSDGNFICKPGDRLPNIRTADGQRLYDCVDRSNHSWVVLNPKETSVWHEKNPGSGGLKVLCAAASDEQDPSPKVSRESLKTPQAILIRPDLYVAAIDRGTEDAWERVQALLGRNISLDVSLGI